MDLLPIENLIYEIRGRKVMLDFDLAGIYEVETAQLKRAVRRNIERFEGEDFMFELTKEELSRCQFGILNKGRGSNIKYMPFAFTELGVAMLSSVLHSDVAIKANRKIMRAFVAVRQLVLSQPPADEIKELQREMTKLKQYVEETFTDCTDINEDTRLQLEQLNRLFAEMTQNRLPAKPRRKIGFFTEEQRNNKEDIIE